MKNKNNQNLTGVVYVRTAVDDQAGIESLEHQKNICEGYCEMNEIEVLKVFQDEHSSGFDAYRPGLIEAIQYCRKHSVGKFIVVKMSRIARSVMIIEVVTEALDQSKTDIQTAMDIGADWQLDL